MRSFEDRPAGVGEEAAGTDQDDDRQDREGEGEVVAGAEVAARKLEDEADQEGADQRAERAAQPPRHRCGQGYEEEPESEVRIERADALGQDESGITGDQARKEKRRPGGPGGVDPRHARKLAVL